MSEKLLEIKDLEVVYSANKRVVHAVNGVSFDLMPGETLGVVGETGAGKTTIAKSIIGILPDPPAKVLKGEILFKGENLLKKSEKEMRKIRGNHISMIFQDPMTALNPTYTIGDQIAEAIRLHEKQLSKREVTEKAFSMLEMVGISTDRYDEYPHQFSGGMKQRVVIAMALACNPDLLLADEPTTALDVTIQAQVLDMMDKLKKELNTAMIMITHDLGIIAKVCDRVAVVYAGEVVESGNREDIFDHPMHPYTLGLFGSLPSLASAQKRLHPISGMMPDPENLPEGCNFSPRCVQADDTCKNCAASLTEVTPGHFVRCFRAGKGE